MNINNVSEEKWWESKISYDPTKPKVDKKKSINVDGKWIEKEEYSRINLPILLEKLLILDRCVEESDEFFDTLLFIIDNGYLIRYKKLDPDDEFSKLMSSVIKLYGRHLHPAAEYHKNKIMSMILVRNRNIFINDLLED